MQKLLEKLSGKYKHTWIRFELYTRRRSFKGYLLQCINEKLLMLKQEKKRIMVVAEKKSVMIFNMCYNWIVKIFFFFINNCYSESLIIVTFIFYLINLQEQKPKRFLTKKKLKNGFKILDLAIFFIVTMVLCIIVILMFIAIAILIKHVIKKW
jgi:hypothetical protein